MNIDRKEMLRYLGSRGLTPDSRLTARMDEAIGLCLSASTPRCVFRRFDYDGTLAPGGYSPQSADVEKLLSGCRAAYLFAATLGSGIEREEERAFARGDSLGAALLDAAASCLIESYCDEECGKLARAENAALTPRFSCGYGDYPLSHQPEILRLLDAQRSIGLHVSSGGIMVPRKSVTAIMGVCGCAAGKTHAPDKCDGCAAAACPYRKTPDPSGEQDK